jgi:hypothetical protein
MSIARPNANVQPRRPNNVIIHQPRYRSYFRGAIIQDRLGSRGLGGDAVDISSAESSSVGCTGGGGRLHNMTPDRPDSQIIPIVATAMTNGTAINIAGPAP